MKHSKLIIASSLIALFHTSPTLSAGGIVVDAAGVEVTSTNGRCVYWGDKPNLDNCMNQNANNDTQEPVAATEEMDKTEMSPAPEVITPEVIAPVVVAPVVAPQAPVTEEPKAKKIINLEGVTFETGSSNLTASSLDKLNNSAQELISSQETKVIVAGHTDNTGDTLNNLELSQSRAETVRDYLIEQGVDASQLTARGYGDTEPTASNDTASGRSENRRVELRIY